MVLEVSTTFRDENQLPVVIETIKHRFPSIIEWNGNAKSKLREIDHVHVNIVALGDCSCNVYCHSFQQITQSVICVFHFIELSVQARFYDSRAMFIRAVDIHLHILAVEILTGVNTYYFLDHPSNLV